MTPGALCAKHWAQLLQGTLSTAVNTQPRRWGRQGCSSLQRQAHTSGRVPATPGEEEWGHRRCVLAWLGAFARGGEAQAQERWAGVLEALPSS